MFIVRSDKVMLRNVEMNGDASLVAFALGRSVQLLVLLQR